jgi:response regulator RpfG family c-di-GMP phosphodiesterase
MTEAIETSDNVKTTPATILCVDDEANILSSLRRLLRPTGHRILTAESGAAGLALLATESVDLVISDMRMPEMDGAHFLEQVRERWPRTMRVLLTGYADMASTVNAINRGQIYRYISKPWNDAELPLVIKEALERQSLLAENARLQALTLEQNAQLRELNEGLERKVTERTGELNQVNSFLNLANQQLKKKFLVSIKTFTGLIELRGGVMAGHSRRVGELARRLAEECGLDERAQHDVFLAGLLHDIGKIGMSDSVLARPVSTLNGSQMAEYCRHAVDGETALMPLEELRDAARLIRSHHEHFNGHGFPDSLRGEEIPLGSRILAVVNDYDGFQIGTLAEKKMTPDQARGLLQQLAGKRYDPQVVEVFVRLLEQERLGQPSEKLVPTYQLTPGMILARDFLGDNGALLLAADIQLTPLIIAQIQTMATRRNQALVLPIRVDAEKPVAVKSLPTGSSA